MKEEELAIYFYANKRSPNGEPSCKWVAGLVVSSCGRW